MMSVMRLITDPNAQFEGEVLYKGTNLMSLPQDQIRVDSRRRASAMIFQDPMTSLNPVYKVGWQIEEQIRAHEKVGKQAARDRAIELLTVGRHPERARARRRLPAPVLGRHAAAGHDRDGRLAATPTCSSPTSRRPPST